MLKKILDWILRRHPEYYREIISRDIQHTADILCEDFLGIMPKKEVDKSALDFLSRNKGIFEPWLIKISHMLQKENVIQEETLHKDEFYAGAKFIIRLLYSRTIKGSNQVTEPIISKEQTNKNPEVELEKFLTGMKEKNNDQES